MNRCKCGSYAINPNIFPRTGKYLELCDVCYFKTRLAETEQRLAAAEAKLPRWIPVGESMPTIAEPYVEYGEWVLGKEQYYKVPTICCRTWIDKEQNYWEWTAENGEVIDITHWMVIPNTLDAATDAPKQEETV